MDNIFKEIRKDILKTSFTGRDGNIPSCFSSVEIIWTLYDRFLELTPEKIKQPVHNRFILSKGQSNLAFLMVLAYKGFISKAEMQNFCKMDSRISMQADRTKFDGCVEVSAGSLGHGFPIAVGMAWAAKIKQTKEQIYVLAGDGEMNEGSMWEAALFAASEKLDNLTLIIDDNASVRRMIDFGSMEEKLESFGFHVQTADGHDMEELSQVLGKKREQYPMAIVAKTKRGYGSETLMQDRSWFHRCPNEEELNMLLAEVDAF